MVRQMAFAASVPHVFIITARMFVRGVASKMWSTFRIAMEPMN